MSATDYVWLGFFILAVLFGFAIAADEIVQASKRKNDEENA